MDQIPPPILFGQGLISYIASRFDAAMIPYVLWGRAYLRILGIGGTYCLQNIPDTKNPRQYKECLEPTEDNDTVEFIIPDSKWDAAIAMLKDLGFSDELVLPDTCRFYNPRQQYVSPNMIPDKCLHTHIGARWNHDHKHQFNGHVEIGLYRQSLWLWHLADLSICITQPDIVIWATDLRLPHPCQCDYTCLKDMPTKGKGIRVCPSIHPATDYSPIPLGRHLIRSENNVPPDEVKILAPARFIEALFLLQLRDEGIYCVMNYWEHLTIRFWKTTPDCLADELLLATNAHAPWFQAMNGPRRVLEFHRKAGAFLLGEKLSQYERQWRHSPSLHIQNQQEFVQKELGKDKGLSVNDLNVRKYMGESRDERKRAAELWKANGIPNSPFHWMPRSVAERDAVTSGLWI